MSPTELAWAAGFFDGEGWTTYADKQHRLPSIRIGVGQQRREPMDRFATAVGFGKVHGPHTNTMYAWATSGSKALYVMDLLWPYLSLPKKEQFSNLLQRVNELRTEAGGHQVGERETRRYFGREGARVQPGRFVLSG